MNVIDYLMRRLENPDGDFGDLDERQERWIYMSAAKRSELQNKAAVIRQLLPLLEDTTRAQTPDGLTRLPPGVAEQAIAEMGIKTRATLHNYIDKALWFRQHYPDQPLAYALINMAGRKPNQILTPDEQLFAIGAYLNTEWSFLIDKGTSYRNKTRVHSSYIYEWLTHVFPSVQERMKPAGLERFLSMVATEDEALFTLSWYGAAAAWANFVIKLPNNLTEPNQVTQLDGRALPIVVISEEGIRCTVTIIPIVDAFSRYVPTFLLVPRRAENELGEIQRVDFRYQDVAKLVAIAMMNMGCRPGFFYSDNASQFKTIERIISYLMNSGEDDLQLIRGFPGHPWGRGIVEVVQQLVDSVLKGLPGFVEDEDDLAAWAKAYKNATLSVEELERLIKRHFEKWNKRARKDQPGRYDVWKDSPQTRRPLPSPDQLFHLGFGADWKTYLVRDSHIDFDGGYYHIKYSNKPEVRARWENAINKYRPVWKIEYHDHQGRSITKVFACLDNKNYDELIKSKTTESAESTASPQKRFRNQQASINSLKQRQIALEKEFMALVERMGGQIPILDTVEKTVVFSDTGTIEEPAEVSAATEEASVSSTAPVAQRTSSTSEASDPAAQAAQDSDTKEDEDTEEHSITADEDDTVTEKQESVLARRMRERRNKRKNSNR